MDDASLEVLRSMGRAPNIHDRLTRYTITPDGGKLIVGQLIIQHLLGIAMFHTGFR